MQSSRTTRVLSTVRRADAAAERAQRYVAHRPSLELLIVGLVTLAVALACGWR